jgi:FkbM family methyltransferase
MNESGASVARMMMKICYWKLAAKLKIWGLVTLRKWGLLPYLNFTLSIAENGAIIRIPLLAGAGIDNIFLSERWMIPLLRQFLNLTEGVFIDIGANIGQTLIKLKRARPSQAYIGFEPNPVCMNYLHELINENSFSDTQIIPTGIFEKPALMQLISYDTADKVPGDATIMGKDFRPTRDVADCKWVALLPFDTAVESMNVGSIGFIKIDVEGAEIPVLNSLKNTIKRWRPILLVEILPMATATETARKNAKLEKFFGERNYAFMRVQKTGQTLAGLATIGKIGKNEDPDGWDYVFLPNEHRERISTPHAGRGL